MTPLCSAVVYRRLAAAVVVAALGSAVPALADTMETVNVSLGAAYQYGDNFSIPITFQGFNSTLGTLNAVALSFSGTIPRGANDEESDSIASGSDFNGALLSNDVLSLGSPSGNLTIKLAGNPVSAYVATGNLTYYLDRNLDPIAIPDLSGTVTYSYTPAAPVSVTPEPSGFVLLGTGLLGAAGMLRRRFAGALAPSARS